MQCSQDSDLLIEKVMDSIGGDRQSPGTLKLEGNPRTGAEKMPE